VGSSGACSESLGDEEAPGGCALDPGVGTVASSTPHVTPILDTTPTSAAWRCGTPVLAGYSACAQLQQQLRLRCRSGPDFASPVNSSSEDPDLSPILRIWRIMPIYTL
jgi:hypothetical protein